MHQTSICRPLRIARALCLGGVLAGASVAFAADTTQSQGIQARYEKERANCMNGQAIQDKKTCLKEAGAAREEALKGVANTGTDAATLQRNAMQRCKTLPAAEQSACRERMQGQGTTSGGVKTGGMLRELTEVEPARAPATSPAPVTAPVPLEKK